MLTVKPLRCINTLWLGVYVRYTPWNMLDIPQQNPLKYGFSGIEIYIFNILQFLDIRLSHGTDITEGVLEINENRRWGIVCNDSFNDVAAAVVCRQLRFGQPVFYRGNSYITNLEVHHAYYYYSSYCSQSSQRFSHCFYYYTSIGSCYETYLKCSSKKINHYSSI